ncbi:toll/interleukin-1 receptor domain-containing protein [Methyloceanibacter sp. wino2]|uniref:toll/interleukin-1 receptor domain-containing protein n=1 Tax=Methyloceanibacter sp. wino2 TaxID=2170729 RepID=UPI00131F3393|nr:toll/interleukin-1 receptor domain-containing protein [Methyloceanibacter sp. wino2]
MKVSERLALVDKIGRELQTRFTFGERDDYLTAWGIARPENVGVNSKWVYSRAALAPQPLSKVIEIAGDLGIDAAGTESNAPANWRDTKLFRLFISHISQEKVKATRLKECLATYGISGFVAHDDIHPTLEWQDEITRALFHMDAFIAMHTRGFSASTWTQQEVGFAVARGVKIVSLRMGEDPTGFIGRRQALPRLQKRAEDIAKEVHELLSEDPRTKDRLASAKTSAIDDDEIPF